MPNSPFKQKLFEGKVDKMLKAGIVESASSSRILLVPKPNSEQSLCVDFRKLNYLSERDSNLLSYRSNSRFR